MKRQTFTNSFAAGMSADVDKTLQKANSYRHARNMRLVFNRDLDKTKPLKEATLDGSSFVLSVIAGNLKAYDYCEGYEPIGWVETTKGTVVFLSDGYSSEIGLMNVTNPADIAGGVQYHTLYNDRNDPNIFNNPFARHQAGAPGGDRLMLSRQYPIHGYSVYENEFTERVYFTDGYNQKRTFNLNDFYKDTALTQPYHPKGTACFTPASGYPKWMSAHAMDEQPDCVKPIIRFKRRIPGKLKTGVYQLFARYRSKAGAVSPVTDLTRRIFITNQPLEDASGNATLTTAIRSNHHNRVMADKNEVVTNEGLRFDITRIDTRWDELEIGYVYHIEETGMREAYIFKKINIGNTITRTVDLVTHNATGNDILVPITADELNQIYTTVLSVASTIEYQNRNYDYNVKLLPDLRVDLSTVTLSPTYKYFREDETLEPGFTSVANPLTKRNDNDPITNTSVTNTTITTSRFAGELDNWAIEEDYLNYKGQQIESNFKGYFRGETYPFGVVLIDRKGNPTLVDYIQDYAFPQQYDDYPNNTLTKKNTDGKYDLRTLGLKVSGVRLKKETLFDEFGRLNVSGFMIVRGERLGVIKSQGYLFPTIMSENCKTDTKNDGFVKPMGFAENQFSLNYQKYEKGDTHLWWNGQSQCQIKSGLLEIATGPDPAFPAFSCPYIFNYHSPDVLFEETIREVARTDQFHHVGQVHRAYTRGRVEMSGNNFHFYTKSYRTEIMSQFNAARDAQYVQNGRPAIGSKSRIKSMTRHYLKENPVYEKFDADYFGYDYSAISDNVLRDAGSQCGWLGYQQPNSLIVRCLDWESVDLAEDDINGSENGCSYRMVNLLQAPESQASPQTVRWMSTGHYQPISLDVLERAAKENNQNGETIAWRFDDIEVWGGDAYVTLFDFSRLYPHIDGCEKVCRNLFGGNGRYYDTASSHVFPIESKYNLALRFGRKFAANATNPLDTACDGAELQFSNGIMSRQPEDWNYNRALLLHESTQFYAGRIQDIKLTQKRPNGLMWSPVKTYGERYDAYRIKLPLDYADLPGELGAGVRLLRQFDYVYAIAEKGFGAVLLSPRELFSTDTSEITIKSGSIYGGFKPISTKYGTAYPLSIWQAENRFGFVDVRKGEVISFGQEGRNLLSEDNAFDDLIARTTLYYPDKADKSTVKDIICGYDEENKEVLLTFRYDIPGTKDAWDAQLKSFTLNYSYLTSSLISVLDVLPDTYVNIGRYLLSFKRNKGLYLHNYGRDGEWYGTYYDSSVRFIVNPSPNLRKVFDNGYLSTTEATTKRLAQMEHTAESGKHTILYVGSDLQLSSQDERVEYFNGLLSYPIHEEDYDDVLPRLEGQYSETELTVKNSYQSIDNQNKRVIFRSFDTTYRITFPVQY